MLSLAAANRHLHDYDWFSFGPVRRFVKHGSRHLETPSSYWNQLPDGRRGYSPLMCAPGLYRQLDAYSHVLVYQPDAVVFSDDLPEFCALPYDYLGAPNKDLEPVLNGGLSLRRVDAFLAVLDGMAEWPSIASYYRHVGMNEDLFWSGVTGIRVAPAEVALGFAWETDPAWWWLGNGRALPMGAHAWERHSPEFWANLGGVRKLALPEAPAAG